jgi:hypothetical protein
MIFGRVNVVSHYLTRLRVARQPDYPIVPTPKFFDVQNPEVINKGNVLIINLSKGNLGTESAHLLGALLITSCSQAAEARPTGCGQEVHSRIRFQEYVTGNESRTS